MKNGQIAVVARVMLNEHIFDWGVGIIGNTLPLHGGIIGSSPIRSTNRRLAQWESVSFTRKGSLVRSQHRLPMRASYNGIT